MKTNERIRDFLYRMSNLICLVVAAGLMIWIAPGADHMRSMGLQDDLIRMAMVAGAVIPALIAASILRMLIGSPTPAPNESRAG
ncbi:hypothetical protein [Pseudomonas mosselii]|uniref:hypothetical protein n=1 Tax=Pseudomonas mosselii TaxID=78327 RepID=UPI0021D82A50|nr:hypothetical protein [Pseudomonas mosselii]MCU9527484.1 hypothetical protein [Pseudomonas mosselii]MCU9534797.1 hypothetical protein [Pseudomonas mosselii]MCU9542731.1 hypothetical protein [Pseudomonas mosselii]MCU9546637.1 hypothetical protein [Pseudomonas mosselii]